MSEETWGVEAPEQRCDSCDAAPPVRFSPDHGAHFCLSCFTREVLPAAPSPDEGETERQQCDMPGCDCMTRYPNPPMTPPVVGDRPEETDTVNDERWREHAAAVVEGAWPNAGDDPQASAAEWSIGVVGELCEIASELLRQPTSPAAGEVRVEWGVRYDPHLVEAKPDEKHARSVVRYYAQHANEPVELVNHRITTYADGSFLTSAWQPVTDEEGQA